MDHKPRVAVLGTGTMGGPMAGQLLKKGFAVHVYNRNPDRAGWLVEQGASFFTTPAEAVLDTDIVIVVVTNTQAVEAVLFGENGAARTNQTNKLFIVMSTIHRDDAVRIGQKLRDLGHRFLDAPVTGGETGAQSGMLTILVGGEENNIAAAHQVLGAVGSKTVHCGPIGSGQVVKACNQIGCAVNLLGTILMLKLAERYGITAKTLVDALSVGAGSSSQFVNLGPEIGRQNFKPGFRIDDLHKDLGFVLSMANNQELDFPMIELIYELLQNNRENGEGALGTPAMSTAFTRLFDRRTE